MAAGSHGNCIHDLGLDICSVDKYNYHDSLQTYVIEGVSHSRRLKRLDTKSSKLLTMNDVTEQHTVNDKTQK